MPDLFDKVNETITKIPMMKRKKKKENEAEFDDDDVGAGFHARPPENEEPEMNIRRRPTRHVRMENNSKKPETHVDEDIIEYIDDEEIDDQ